MTAPSSPAASRASARVRLLVLLALLGALFLPWATLQTPSGVARARGFELLGAVALPFMLVLWGLAATSLLARDDRGARVGATATDLAVAIAGLALLASGHPWTPDPPVAPLRAPALLGLALLALLQVALLLGRSPLEREVAWTRAAAAFLAGIVFLHAEAHLAAGLALWLAFSAGTVALYRPGAEVESLLLLAGVVGLAAPLIARTGSSVGFYLGSYVWMVGCIVLSVLSLRTLWTMRRATAEGPPRPR